MGKTRTWDTTDDTTVNVDLIRVFSRSLVFSAFQTLLPKVRSHRMGRCVCMCRWGVRVEAAQNRDYNRIILAITVICKFNYTYIHKRMM